MLDLTGHMIIWGGLFAHGDGSTGLKKVVFCYALLTVVQGFGANETLHFRTTLFWAQLLPLPAMSPDMNPIEHVWDFIGRRINQRNPKCQNIDELKTAILQEWQQFHQERLRRLVRGMTRHVTELHNKRGGYTRY
jgi:hypothetical protein